MGLRDPYADRQPGAEKRVEVPADVEDVVVPEYAADLPPEQLAVLVETTKQRQLAQHLPNDIAGSGTRRRDPRR